MTPPSIVLLHGFAGQPDVWEPVTASLPRETRVLCPALLGHSPARGSGVGLAGPGEPETFEAEVDRLAELVRTQGFAESQVAGYSLGGRLALGLLLRHPGLFSAATLFGAHPGLSRDEDRRERLVRDDAWAALLEEEGLEAFLDAWEAQPLFATQTQERRARQRRLRSRLEPAALARAMRILSLARMPSFRLELADLPLPITWVAGSADPKFSTLARECAAACPAGRFQILEGAGHNVVLERPEAVAAILHPHRARDRARYNVLEGSLT